MKHLIHKHAFGALMGLLCFQLGIAAATALRPAPGEHLYFQGHLLEGYSGPNIVIRGNVYVPLSCEECQRRDNVYNPWLKSCLPKGFSAGFRPSAEQEAREHLRWLKMTPAERDEIGRAQLRNQVALNSQKAVIEGELYT